MPAQRTVPEPSPVPADDTSNPGTGSGEPEITRLADALATDLWLGFGGRYPRHDLALIVQDAIEDLRGSVAFESLPEMAARLAAVRVTGSGEVMPAFGRGRRDA